MATSNINEIEQLQQNETLKNLLLRIDDDEIEQLQQDDTLKNLLRRIIDDDAIDQPQQNDSLTNLLLRKDEIDDKNLTKDDNNGEEMYPIITHLQEPIFQNTGRCQCCVVSALQIDSVGAMLDIFCAVSRCTN